MLFYGIRKRFKGAFVYRFHSSTALRTWLKTKGNCFVSTAADYFVKQAKKFLRETYPANAHATIWANGIKIVDTRPDGHR